MRTLIFTLLLSFNLSGQDISNNAAVRGDYFVREVLIAGQNASGTITSSLSAIGVATFDGNGNYKFAGAVGNNTSTGVYGVGSNGLLYIQSLVDGTQTAYGGLSGVGPTAFVASATEGTSVDILVAIPAGTSASAASLSGNYTAGYVSFPGANVAQVRQAAFGFTADGAGNLSNVAVSGTALNLGGTTQSQTVSGATYTLTGEGTGALNLGAASASQVLSGSLNFYLSADGNIFLAGTPGGTDLIVGARVFSGTASNSSWNNVYFTGALEDTVSGTTHSLDSFYGSWNANGQGVSITHERFQTVGSSPQAYDSTFDTIATVQGNATVATVDLPYNYKIALGAGGKVFIATGTSGLYSLLIGFATPSYSGTGVYLNPLGVVSAANYAPVTNPIAPGEIITLFGSGLAPGTANASGLPLPTTLSGVQVMINGQAAPLFYVTGGQIAAQVPQAATPGNNVFYATVQVVNNNVKSNAVTVYTNYTAPGMFSAGGNGIGPAAAQLANFSLVTATNPAPIGSTVVFYATGLGTVIPAVADGAAAPSNPPATATDTDAVYIGGTQANILFDGLTPGLAGLFQLNTSVVSGTPSGAQYSDIETPDAYSSQTTLAVGGTSVAMARARARKARKASRSGRVSRVVQTGAR